MNVGMMLGMVGAVAGYYLTLFDPKERAKRHIRDFRRLNPRCHAAVAAVKHLDRRSRVHVHSALAHLGHTMRELRHCTVFDYRASKRKIEAFANMPEKVRTHFKARLDVVKKWTKVKRDRHFAKKSRREILREVLAMRNSKATKRNSKETRRSIRNALANMSRYAP